METKTGGNQHESTGLRNIILTGKGGCSTDRKAEMEPGQIHILIG